MTDALREACARAVHVLTADGAVLRSGRAVLYIMQYVGWGAFARFLAHRPMIWFVELGYFIVARNRKLFSRFMFRDRSLRE
jgi:predicted DCC family thiol-disulfide oxidoreductase YuxK